MAKANTKPQAAIAMNGMIPSIPLWIWLVAFVTLNTIVNYFGIEFTAFVNKIMLVLELYWYIVLAMIIMSWLISFGVVNTRNQFVSQVWRILNQLTDPVLRPIRRWMPNFSGLDLSPLILFLIIFFIQQIITRYIYPNVF